MTSPYLTSTQCHIFMISQHNLLARKFSQKSIWYGAIIKSQSLLRTSQRPPSSPLSASTNSSGCLSDSKNAAQAFQRLMDTVCQGLYFTFVYIDDILVASEDEDTHLDHLHQLFQRLKDYGLVVNVSKCTFGVESLDFLGHCINCDGIVPLPDKVSVITKYPRPETVKALQEFVGMVNCYHRFIPAAAQLMSPLFEALTSQTKTFIWNDTMTQAFDNIKKALAKATLLVHPRHDAPISLTTDASDRAVGAVLQQWAQELPWVLLGIRTAPKEDLGCSSAELVYGAPVTVPGEFFPAHTSQPNHNSELVSP